MISSRLSSALALAVKAHDRQVSKGTLWYYRALADVFTQRRAPMAVCWRPRYGRWSGWPARNGLRPEASRT